MRRLRTATALLFGALIAGCMEATPEAGDARPGPDVGSAPVQTGDAAAMFSKVCVDGYPSYAPPPAFLNDDAFAQNARTGTWYHRTFDLSFNLAPRGGTSICSMVFASREDPVELAVGLSAITSQLVKGTAKVQVDPDKGLAHLPIGPASEMKFEPFRAGGQTMYRAYISAGT